MNFVHVHTCTTINMCYVYIDLMCRLNGRVRKRAMTSFERDQTMSRLSTQLDYQVCVCVHTHMRVCQYTVHVVHTCK